MHGERRHIVDRDIEHLAIGASGVDGHQPHRRLDNHRRHGLHHGDAARLQQGCHGADRVAARHGCDGTLLHHDDGYICARVGWGECQHSAQTRIATRLMQHQATQAVQLARGIGESFRDSVARDEIVHVHDHPTGLTLRVGF